MESPGTTDPDSSKGALGDDNAEGKDDVGYLNLLNIIKLGAGFLLVFSAFVSLQNLMPQVLGELGFEGLGFVLVAVIYSAFIVSCFAAPVLLQYCSERRALPFATLGYALFCATCILPARCPECPPEALTAALIAAAIVIGLCAAFVWVPQSAIMTYNSPQRHTNTYQMVFQACFQFAQPAGSALSYVLVGSATLFFACFTCVSLLGTALLTTIREPQAHPSIPVRKPEHAATTLREAVLPLTHFVTRDRRAFPVACYSVMVSVWFNAVPSCVLPMFVESTSELATLLFVAGIGNLISGMLYGYVANTTSRLVCMVLAVLLHGATVALLAVSGCSSDGETECRSGFVMSASICLGLANGTAFANNLACISAAVHDAVHSASAANQLVISIATIFAFALVPLLSAGWALLTVGSILAISASCLLIQPYYFRTLHLEIESEHGQSEKVKGCGKAPVTEDQHGGASMTAEDGPCGSCL